MSEVDVYVLSRCEVLAEAPAHKPIYFDSKHPVSSLKDNLRFKCLVALSHRLAIVAEFMVVYGLTNVEQLPIPHSSTSL